MNVSSESNDTAASRAVHDTWIVGTSKMAELIRKHDWAKSGFPDIKNWSNTLLTTVNLALQAPVPIAILWGEDGIMFYNDAYAVIAGGRHPGILGSKVLESWPEIAEFNGHVLEVVHGRGETLSYKDQRLTLERSGKPEDAWLDLNYSPIIRSDGSVGGVFAVVIETTETVVALAGQRKAEIDLLEEREQLKSLFEQAPAMIAVLNGPNHIFEMANPFYKRTVAPNRDIVGKPVVEALPELKGQGVIKILDNVLRTGQAYSGEISIELDRFNTGELEEAVFNLVYQPISSRGDGKPDGIFVHAVEITDQVLSRRRAEQLNSELEAIFDSLPDGIFTTDRTSITHVNARGAELLGYSSPEEVPHDLDSFYGNLLVQYSQKGQPKEVDVAHTTIGRALRGESVDTVGARIVNKKTGLKRVIRSAGAPIRNREGEVIGAVATTSDLTEQYELQDKMQKETVRRRVLSQKAKLLKAQNEQLTALNATKDEFIALTSHQLRTPATGVKQYIGMVTQGYAGEVSDQVLDFLNKAYESNDRQLHIIDDILRVARIDLNQIKLSKQRQDITWLVREVVNEQSDSFAGRKQKILLTLPDEPIVTDIDTRNLGMAIGNIVDNASKYTADGKTVTVTLSREENCATLTITDEGVGIAPADLEKLFQKFSRIPNDRSIQVGGTGLGLYLAQKLIEKHNGTVDVASEEGVGTTFTIKLPVLAND